MGILSEFEWRGPLYGSISALLSLCVFLACRRFFAARFPNRSPFRLSFSAGAYLVAAFTVTALASQQAAITTTYIEIVKWSQVASMVGQVSLLLLVARLTRAFPPFALTVALSAYALATLMHVISVSGLFVSFFGEIHLYAVPGMERFIPARVPFALWRLPVDVANGLALMLTAFACWRQFNRGARKQALLASALAAVVSAENLHDMYFAGAIYLAPIGLVLMLAIFIICPEELVVSGGSGITNATRASSRRRSLPWYVVERPFRSARLALWEHNPLVGLIMAMFLVSAAQTLAWKGLDNIIILLALLGLGQATIAGLYREGSGVEMRYLAIVALIIIALPQLADIFYALPFFSGALFTETQRMFHGPLRDWLWILGMLLLLTAFSLSGIEAGEARKRLLLEHRKLIAEAAERKHAQLELQTSERRFRRLVENSTDLVAIIGPDGIVRDIGASVKRILGFAPEVMIGRSASEFCHQDDLPRLERALTHISPGGAAVRSIEIRVRIPDGAWRVVECISDLQFDPVLNGIIVNARDITERRAMEERLKSARNDERQLIRYNLHDTVGQDLAGVLCMAGSLAMELQGASGSLAEQADAIVAGVQRTMEDVRKAILGIAPIELHPRGLEVALDQLAERLKTYHKMDIRFLCSSPAEIDDYGAATQLFQIAQEAMTNAIKHAQASKIVLSLSAAGDRVVLTVVDDGLGIEDRVASTEGLGLQTMRSRAAAIGAWLRISGPAGKGTQVKCILSREPIAENLPEKGLHDFAR